MGSSGPPGVRRVTPVAKHTLSVLASASREDWRTIGLERARIDMNQVSTDFLLPTRAPHVLP